MSNNDLTCTEPKHWPSPPQSDASDEEITTYLDHLDHCPYHSSLEQVKTQAVKQTFALARSMTSDDKLPLSTESRTKVLDNFERYLDFRESGQKVKEIILRGRGIEERRLDLSLKRQKVDFEVTAPYSIQVWTPAMEGQPEIFLATHLVNSSLGENAAKVKSALKIQEDISLIFETVPLGKNRLRVSVKVKNLQKVSLLERLRISKAFSFWGIESPLVASIATAVILIIIFLAGRGIWRRIFLEKGKPSSSDVQFLADKKQSENAPSDNSQEGVEVAPLIIALNDAGGTIGLDQNGKLQGIPSNLPATERQLIENALKTKRVSVAPIPKELTIKTEGRMGTGDESAPFTLLAPIQRTVLTSTPTFVWNPLAGATDYNVKLFDNNDHPVAESGLLKTNSWKLPQSKALTRGKVYAWKVVALKDGVEVSSNTPAATNVRGALTQSKFKVLDSRELREINKAKKDYGNSHLLLGLVYARAGLLEEAEHEFSALLRANPQSKVAQELLRSIKAAPR